MWGCSTATNRFFKNNDLKLNHVVRWYKMHWYDLLIVIDIFGNCSEFLEKNLLSLFIVTNRRNGQLRFAYNYIISINFVLHFVLFCNFEIVRFLIFATAGKINVPHNNDSANEAFLQPFKVKILKTHYRPYSRSLFRERITTFVLSLSHLTSKII